MPLLIPDDLQARFNDALSVASDGAWELTVPPESLHEALAFLGLDRTPPFALFLDLFGVDTLGAPDAPASGGDIEVIYQLSRPCTAELIRVKTRVSRRGGSVPTVTDIWPGAGWPERELMEMFGVGIEGQPDPRHLLLPEGWKGFPLRKDYQYPTDHPYLSRDPLHEDPARALGPSPAAAAPEADTPQPE
jgi:NADH-quinone oxidoreductase subunit C